MAALHRDDSADTLILGEPEVVDVRDDSLGGSQNDDPGAPGVPVAPDTDRQPHANTDAQPPEHGAPVVPVADGPKSLKRKFDDPGVPVAPVAPVANLNVAGSSSNSWIPYLFCSGYRCSNALAPKSRFCEYHKDGYMRMLRDSMNSGTESTFFTLFEDPASGANMLEAYMREHPRMIHV